MRFYSFSLCLSLASFYITNILQRTLFICNYLYLCKFTVMTYNFCSLFSRAKWKLRIKFFLLIHLECSLIFLVQAVDYSKICEFFFHFYEFYCESILIRFSTKLGVIFFLFFLTNFVDLFFYWLELTRRLFFIICACYSINNSLFCFSCWNIGQSISQKFQCVFIFIETITWTNVTESLKLVPQLTSFHENSDIMICYCESTFNENEEKSPSFPGCEKYYAD